jgi:putative phosphoesterase
LNIAIISDTHFHKNKGQLENLPPDFGNIDLLIHAGDYNQVWVLKYLQDHFNFIGVWGNNDDNTIKSLLQEKLIINIESYRIGICHGHGKRKSTIERAYSYFEENSVDIIIFGHSHKPVISTKRKVLMLNPGSLTSKRKERWFSYILLSFSSKKVQANLIMTEV